MKKPEDVGSAAFVAVGENRDSLEPVAVPASGPIVHRRVCEDREAREFSASRGHPVFPVKLPSTTVSFSVGELEPSAAASNHRHAYESLLFILEGEGWSIIEGERVEWAAGDAIYVPPWNWHQHFASDRGRVRYLTGTNLPLLVRLGQTVVRQEAASKETRDASSRQDVRLEGLEQEVLRPTEP